MKKLSSLFCVGALLLLGSCTAPGVPIGGACYSPQPKPVVYAPPPQCSPAQSFLLSFQQVSAPQSPQFSVSLQQYQPPQQIPQIQYYSAPPQQMQFQTPCFCPPPQQMQQAQPGGLKFKILGYGNAPNSTQQYIYVQPETATGTFELQTVRPD